VVQQYDLLVVPVVVASVQASLMCVIVVL
jgi:hypothetical protein